MKPIPFPEKQQRQAMRLVSADSRRSRVEPMFAVLRERGSLPRVLRMEPDPATGVIESLTCAADDRAELLTHILAGTRPEKTGWRKLIARLFPPPTKGTP